MKKPFSSGALEEPVSAVTAVTYEGEYRVASVKNV
jgi:hypothetical protein